MEKLFFILLLFPVLGFSQTKSVALLTGAKITNYGLSFKDIEFELDEDTWISNRLPLNKEFKIIMNKPSSLGFKVENGNCYPGIALLLLKPNRDTIANIPNYYTFSDGLDASMMTKLSVTLNFTDPFKTGDSLVLVTTFYDTKGENKTLIEFPMIFVDSLLPLENTKSLYAGSSTYSYEYYSCFEIGDIHYLSDTLNSRVKKSVLVEGINMDLVEFRSGKETIRLYDSKMNEVFDENLIKSLGIETLRFERTKSNEELTDNDLKVKSTLSISVSSSIKKVSKKYYVVYRWESLDRKKVLVLKNPFNF